MFPPQNRIERFVRWLIPAKLRDLRFSPKYDHRNVERILKERFGDDTTLGSALCNVMITSYDVTNRATKFFTSWEESTRGYRMWEVARATSAAPTYFEPFKPRWAAAGEDTLIDGVVFANNPGLYAFIKAKERHAVANDKILLVSLGTGVVRSVQYEKNKKEYPYEIVKGFGTAAWAKPIIDITFFSICETVDYALAQLLGHADQPQQFYRYQVKLKEESEDLDNAMPKNIDGLKEEVVKQIIRPTHSTEPEEKWLNPDLGTLCRLLKDNSARRVGE